MSDAERMSAALARVMEGIQARKQAGVKEEPAQPVKERRAAPVPLVPAMECRISVSAIRFFML